MATRTTNGPTDVDRFRFALDETKTFVYEHLVWLTIISITWFFTSLLIITIGFATLGAYAAIHSLYNRGTVDHRYLFKILRRHGIESIVLHTFLLVLGGGTLLYLQRGTTSDSVLPLLFGLFGSYALVHLGLVFTIALVLLAEDRPLVPSLRAAYLLTVNHLTAVLMVALVTLVLLLGTGVLIVGFVLLFPTVTFSFHVLVVTSLLRGEQDGSAERSVGGSDVTDGG